MLFFQELSPRVRRKRLPRVGPRGCSTVAARGDRMVHLNIEQVCNKQAGTIYMHNTY